MTSRIDYEELVRSYIQAENKGAQIHVLAELTLSDEETIIEVLKDHGVFHEEDIEDSLRECHRCGKKYVARTMRGRATCPECVRYHRKEIVKAANERKKQKRRVEDMTNNDQEKRRPKNLLDLNQKLFDRIEALEDDSLTDEQLEKEIRKAETVTKIAGAIMENANLALKAQQQFDEYGTGRTVDIPLLGISNEGLAQENKALRRRLQRMEDGLEG